MHARCATNRCLPELVWPSEQAAPNAGSQRHERRGQPKEASDIAVFVAGVMPMAMLEPECNLFFGFASNAPILAVPKADETAWTAGLQQAIDLLPEMFACRFQ